MITSRSALHDLSAALESQRRSTEPDIVSGTWRWKVRQHLAGDPRPARQRVDLARGQLAGRPRRHRPAGAQRAAGPGVGPRAAGAAEHRRRRAAARPPAPGRRRRPPPAATARPRLRRGRVRARRLGVARAPRPAGTPTLGRVSGARGCRHGGVPEWPIGTALKAVAGRDVSRGFESRPLCCSARAGLGAYSRRSEDVALLDDVARGDLDLGDDAGQLGDHGDLHLHRLEQAHGVADGDLRRRGRPRPSARWPPSPRRSRARAPPWRRRYNPRGASQQRLGAARLGAYGARLLLTRRAAAGRAGEQQVGPDQHDADEQPDHQAVDLGQDHLGGA